MITQRVSVLQVIGLDIGTTTVSGVRLNPCSGELCAVACRHHGGDVAGLSEGWHEQDTELLFQAASDVLDELSGEGAVGALAVTGQMHGLVAVDASLRPLTRLITWRDRRTVDVPDAIRFHGHATETGCFLNPGYGGLTLSHLIANGALPHGAVKVLSAPGYVVARLTGRCVTDETLAASWGIWNLGANRWHEPLLRSLRIAPTILPEYVPSGMPVGTTSDGIAVHSPLGDNQAGVLGMLDGFDNGAVVNIGTSSQLSVPLRNFAFDPRFETRPMPGGGFIQTHAILCGGWTYAYLAGFLQKVTAEISGVEPALVEVFDAMERMAAGNGADGLRVDPRFDGSRTGDVALHGAITGITRGNLTPGNLVRAFAEGIAGELAEALTVVENGGISSLALIGNAVRRNRVLREAMASVSGLPCRVTAMEEEAAYGAALNVFRQNIEIKQ